MGIFFKGVAAILAALILWLSIESRSKEISVLLTLCVCAMVILSAAAFLKPVIAFVHTLISLGNLDKGSVGVVLKAVGMGLVAEMAALICKDAKNETMGKVLQFMCTVALIWIAIPVLESFVELLNGILGEL